LNAGTKYRKGRQNSLLSCYVKLRKGPEQEREDREEREYGNNNKNSSAPTQIEYGDCPR
jgi:hypothetical protein